jgi:lysophospholipase L1-like esterase
MPTDQPSPPRPTGHDGRCHWPARWIATVAEAGVVAAWFLLVLRDQYGVASLQPHEIALDGLFLATVLGAVAARLAARRGVTALRGVAVRVAVMVVATAGAILGAEYVARYMFRNERSSGNVGDYVARQAAGPAIVVNGLGFREREIPAKDTGRYRIAVVGDSFTWGQGIEVGERFSNLLESFLGPRFEVLNFGLPGDNMPEHLDVLKRALTVSPDFVLLQLYINDFEMPDMQRPRPYPLLPASVDHDLEESSVIYDLLNGQWHHLQEVLGVVDSYERYMARNLRDPNAPRSQEAFGMLRAFIHRSHVAGVSCGLVLFPAADAMGPSGSNYPFGYLHDGVHTTCADERIPCLDLLAAFSKFKDPRQMWVSRFDAHPNALANRRAAYEILQEFATSWGH